MTAPMGRGPAPSGFRRRMPSEVTFIVIRREPEWTLAAVAERHLKAGFVAVGYHYGITPDGKVIQGRSSFRPAALEGDFNEASISVALLGSPEWAQVEARQTLIKFLLDQYPQATLKDLG